MLIGFTLGRGEDGSNECSPFSLLVPWCIMSKADTLNGCTDILTELAEAVEERPDVRTQMYPIKIPRQGQIPGVSNKENMPSRSAFTPALPLRAA